MQVVNLLFSADFLHDTLRATTAILFATLAAGIAAKAAVFNIAIEGMMLIAALTGVLFSAWLQSAWAGLFFALLSGGLTGLLLGALILKLRTDAILAGVAINLMAVGGTGFVLYLASGDRGISTGLASLSLPVITIAPFEHVPILNGLFYQQNVLTYLALLAVVAQHILLFRTPLGLRIRAVGENPHAAESVGIKAPRIQYIALAMSGVLAAFGGAFLSMGYLSWFTENMTAGRGFIGLAASAMAANNPKGALLVALLFGATSAAVNVFQTGISLPHELIQMLPYLATIFFFTMFSYRRVARSRKALHVG